MKLPAKNYQAEMSSDTLTGKHGCCVMKTEDEEELHLWTLEVY